MDFVFEDYFDKCIIEATKVRYDDNLDRRLSAYVKRMADAKSKEVHHQNDKYNEEKRIMTGLLGELALEYTLGIKFIDWSIGKSADYHIPDIPGYKVGIKTVEYGKFPIIFKKNYYPQIICVVKKDEKAVYVCGIADVETLNRYQSDDPMRGEKSTTTLKDVAGLDEVKVELMELIAGFNEKEKSYPCG